MNNQPVHVSAPTVEEAIARGLSLLGLTRDQVKIEVVEGGRRGILGIGTREATVCLEALSPAVATIPTADLAGEPVQVAHAEPVDAQVAESEPESGWDDELGFEEEEGEEEEEEQAQRQGYEPSEEQIAETARQVLTELLTKMGIQAQVAVHVDRSAADSKADEERLIVLDVQGENLDELIGDRGKALNALQHITRLIVSREVECWVDLVVDVEMYKQRRANSLHKLALRMAERVAHSKQPVALEPMPPNERREVHIALRNHPDVTTQSVGRGDNRKVTIIPRH